MRHGELQLLDQLGKNIAMNDATQQGGNWNRKFWASLSPLFLKKCGASVDVGMQEQLMKTLMKGSLNEEEGERSRAYRIVANVATSLDLDRVVEMAERFNLRELLQRDQHQHDGARGGSGGGETKAGCADSDDDDDDETHNLVAHTIAAFMHTGRPWDHSTSMVVRLLHDIGADPTSHLSPLLGRSQTTCGSAAAWECFARLGAPIDRVTVSMSPSTPGSGRTKATMHALALYMNKVVCEPSGCIQPYKKNAVGKVGLGDDGNGWKAVANEHIEKTELQDVLRTLAVLIRSVDVDDMPDLALSNGEAIQ